MKIRRYTCKDMQEALLKVKMDLGSEAVIMNSRKVKAKGLKGLFSKPMIEVVAAIDDDYVRPSLTNLLNKKTSSTANAGLTQLNTQEAGINNYHPQKGYTKQEPAGTDRQIVELEKKVKSMEDTLTKIYQALQGKQEKIPVSESVNKISENYNLNHTLNNTPEPSVNPDIHQNQINEKDVWEPLSNQAVKTEPGIGIKPDIKPEFEVSVNTENKSDESPISQDVFSQLKKLLFTQDLDPKLIEKVLDKLREKDVKSEEEAINLARRILTILLGKPEPLEIKEKQPHIAIFIGPTGVGKTTTLAKIAAEFSLNRQKKVGLITADTYRIAAIEQLKTYAEILNIPLKVVYSPNEIKDAISQLADKDLILIDTAGRSYKNKAHFDELKTLVSFTNADDTFLVLSCNTSPRAINETLEYYAFLKNFKLIFTKLDESPTKGVIFNARYMTGKPLSYTTAGQSVPDDLDNANPNELVADIFK